MIDTLNFYIPIDTQKALAGTKLKWQSNNGIYWTANIKNLKLTIKDNRFYINGSIAKYANKDLEGLGIKDGLQALKDLEQTLKADFSKSVVCRVDYCKTLEMLKPPYYYLECFDQAPRYIKGTYCKNQKETVTYFTKTGSKAFCIYDKGQEIKAPPPFHSMKVDKSFLRLEFRIIKRNAVQRILGNNNTVSALQIFTKESFAILESEYMDFYKSIAKHDLTDGYIEIKEPCKPSLFFEYITANYKALHPKEYDTLLKDFVKNMDKKSRYRTLAKERKNGFLEGAKGKNGILYELDLKNAIQAQ